MKYIFLWISSQTDFCIDKEISFINTMYGESPVKFQLYEEMYKKFSAKNIENWKSYYSLKIDVFLYLTGENFINMIKILSLSLSLFPPLSLSSHFIVFFCIYLMKELLLYFVYISNYLQNMFSYTFFILNEISQLSNYTKTKRIKDFNQFLNA